MDQYIDRNNKKYNIISNYKEKDNLRASLNALTKRTFGFDFEQWYQAGFWQEKYLPYSLLDGDNIVANVSVNLMDFLIDGETKRYIQIGTVMTDPTYRGLGLSRALFEKIFSDWTDKCELFYLFANDSVLNFYPRLGFKTAVEYQYSKPILKKLTSTTFKKIDIFNKKDTDLLFHIVSNAVPLSRISMLNNTSLVMFHCTNSMKDSLYYVNDYDAVIAADFNGNTLFVHDVFSTKMVNLDNMLNSFLNEHVTHVVLGFTPEHIDSYQIDLLKEEDTTLFVKVIKDDMFLNGMFPVLSHA